MSFKGKYARGRGRTSFEEKACLEYTILLLNAWYDCLLSNGEITVDLSSPHSSFPCAASSSSSTGPSDSYSFKNTHDSVMSEVFLLQAFGISRELRNKFPLGFSVLLQRAFFSPISVYSKVEHITIRHVIEYWFISKQVEAHTSHGKVHEFVSSILSLKPQVELIDAYVDLVIFNESDLLPYPPSDGSSTSSSEEDILHLLASHLLSEFDADLSKESVKRLYRHSLGRYNQLLHWITPRGPLYRLLGAAFSGIRSPEPCHVDLRESTFTSLITALELHISEDATLCAMGQRFPCHISPLYLVWPFFRHFISISTTTSSTADFSAPNPSKNPTRPRDMQNDDSTVFLDFGDRLMPEAVKCLLQFFKGGQVKQFKDYIAAKSILVHAEELRLADPEGNGLPGFSYLITHLKTIKPSQDDFTPIVPTNDCFFALAFAMETQDKQIWDKVVETLCIRGSHAFGASDSAKWFHQKYPDAYWLATWSLVSGKNEYPFKPLI